jgi:hypothetical protein
MTCQRLWKQAFCPAATKKEKNKNVIMPRAKSNNPLMLFVHLGGNSQTTTVAYDRIINNPVYQRFLDRFSLRYLGISFQSTTSHSDMVKKALVEVKKQIGFLKPYCGQELTVVLSGYSLGGNVATHLAAMLEKKYAGENSNNESFHIKLMLITQSAPTSGSAPAIAFVKNFIWQQFFGPEDLLAHNHSDGGLLTFIALACVLFYPLLFSICKVVGDALMPPAPVVAASVSHYSMAITGDRLVRHPIRGSRHLIFTPSPGSHIPVHQQPVHTCCPQWLTLALECLDLLKGNVEKADVLNIRDITKKLNARQESDQVYKDSARILTGGAIGNDFDVAECLQGIFEALSKHDALSKRKRCGQKTALKRLEAGMNNLGISVPNQQSRVRFASS